MLIDKIQSLISRVMCLPSVATEGIGGILSGYDIFSFGHKC